MKPLKYFIALLLTFNSHYTFAQKNADSGHLKEVVKVFSKFENSHDLTKHILKNYKHDSLRKAYLKSTLNQKEFNLPKVKSKKDKLYFKIQGKTYSFKVIDKDVYEINGKKVKVDYEGEKFVSFKAIKVLSVSGLFNLLFYPSEVEAAVPMLLVYFAVVAGVLTISFSCSGQNISRYFNVGDSISSKTVRAQSARIRRMNNALNEAIASVVPFCAGAANASPSDVGLEFVNFDLAFQDYCDQLADASVERSANSLFSRPFNEAGEFNPRFENQLRDAAPVYNIGDVVPSYLENMSFEICSSPNCRDRNPERVPFSSLSETSQQIIEAHFRNRNFSRNCVMDAFYRMENRNLRSYRAIEEMTEEAESLE